MMKPAGLWVRGPLLCALTTATHGTHQVVPRTAPHLAGDNDPLDVLEIGEQVARVGEVYPVKVLGALGMMDGGGDGEEFEMDWKIIAVRATDPLAAVLNGAWACCGVCGWHVAVAGHHPCAF